MNINTTLSVLSLPCFFALLLVILLNACATTETASQQSSGTTKSQWKGLVESAANNHERLHRLLQGTYVRYSYLDKKTKKRRPWLVNDGKDSVVYHIRAIGDPNKDGYCLLHCLFMTHLPNRPLVTYLSKVERITRDSFVLTSYEVPEATLKTIVDGSLEKEMDLKVLTRTETTAIYSYVKESNERFRLMTARKRYAIGKDKARAFYQSLGYVDFMVHNEEAIFYDEDLNKTQSAFNYDIRRYNVNLKTLSQVAL